MTGNYIERWRHRAKAPDFDTYQELSDSRLWKILRSMRTRDDHRQRTILGILMNRQGLERDKDL